MSSYLDTYSHVCYIFTFHFIITNQNKVAAARGTAPEDAHAREVVAVRRRAHRPKLPASWFGFKYTYLTEMWSGFEKGSYSRTVYCYITQL